MKDPGLIVTYPAPRRARQIRLTLIGVSLAVLCVALLAMTIRTPKVASAQEEGSADIVVQFDDNARVVRGLRVSLPVSGLSALQQSGLNVVIADTNFGKAVCSIEGVGCPAEDCFCNSEQYWGYSWWDGTAWQPYQVGAAASLITQTGAIEGWRWGAWGDAQVDAGQSTAARAALGWLSGATPSRNQPPSAGATLEMMLAAGANLQHAVSWPAASAPTTLQDDLALTGAPYSRSSAGAAGKLATAVVASGACLPAGALSPSAWYSPTLGAYSARGTGDNAWAVLGALSLGDTPPAAALDHLRSLALANGAWEWSPGWGADTNSTSLALQALIGSGEAITSSSVISGLAWLKLAQNADGGFPYSPGPQAGSDSNSTAYVVQALIAAGEQVDGPAWQPSGNSPVDFLLARQQENGAMEWQVGTGPDVLATQQSVAALLRRPFPIAIGSPEVCPAIHLPITRAGE